MKKIAACALTVLFVGFLPSVPTQKLKKKVTFNPIKQIKIFSPMKRIMPKVKSNFFKDFPKAVHNANLGVVEKWISKRKDINFQIYSPEKNAMVTMLAYAIHEQSPTQALDVVKALIKAGAYVNTGTPGNTPLSAAVRANKVEIFEGLLLHGADANMRWFGLPSAWEEAASLNRVEILALKDRFQPPSVSLQAAEVIDPQAKIQADNDWVDSLFENEKQ